MGEGAGRTPLSYNLSGSYGGSSGHEEDAPLVAEDRRRHVQPASGITECIRVALMAARRLGSGLDRGAACTAATAGDAVHSFYAQEERRARRRRR